MKYPAILKSKSEIDTRIMLAYNRNEAARISSEPIDLFGGFNFDTSDAWQNITREYLANTYGEVESKEHAEFIVKLAENAGLVVNGYFEPNWFCVNHDVLNFVSQKANVINSHKEIIIPLPPKESKLPVASSGTKMPKVKEPKKVSINEIKVNVTNNTDSLVQIKKSDDESSIFIYVNDPPKEPEPKEWPQVGDEVSLRYRFDSKEIHITGKLEFISDKHLIVDDCHKLRSEYDIEKPLTPEEELTKELEKMVYDGMDNSYDLNHNCYYLVSGLMKKYDIKKRPE